MRKTASLALLLGLALAVVGRLPFGKEVRDLVMAEGDMDKVDERTTLYLDSFRVLRYPSGKPRQYVSAVKALDCEGRSLSATEISVNHPLRLNGWWIYQYGYGPDQTDAMCTQLRCVRDPMLPVAALGGLLVLLGALGMCGANGRNVRGTGVPPVQNGQDARSPGEPCSSVRKALAWVAALAAVALPVFIIGRAVMRPEPLPALQSWLMAPHVAAYSASYIILLFAVFGIGRRFVPLGFLLMTLGLVLGAVWGKIAWSEWWQFDPKENWSFFTWLAFALGLQFPANTRTAKWLLRIGAVLIVITLTWVNFSRWASGLHSYA